MEGRAQTYKQTYNRIIFDEQDDAIRRRTMESLHNRRRLADRQPARPMPPHLPQGSALQRERSGRLSHRAGEDWLCF